MQTITPWEVLFWIIGIWVVLMIILLGMTGAINKLINNKKPGEQRIHENNRSFTNRSFSDG